MSASNARLIAELQSVSIAIRLFGLERLPEVMGEGRASVSQSIGEGERSEVRATPNTDSEATS